MKMRSTPLLPALTVFFLLIFTNALSAQTSTGIIKGVVTDSHGAVIQAAFVRIRSQTNKKFESGAFADSNGKFIVKDLPPDTYEISSDVSGMVYKKNDILITGSDTIELNVLVAYEGNCVFARDGKNLELSDDDRKKIISLALEDALVTGKIPDHAMLVKQKGNVVLSLETIKPEWVVQPEGVTLTLMSRKDLRNRANRDGDFLYLAFSKWKVGKDCVAVTFSNTWMSADNSDMAYLSGGGTHYLYYKENGRWKGKNLGGWIS